MILSTDHVLAFLDIMPLTRGHVLVASRRHYEMLGDMGVEAGQEVCIFHLPGCDQAPALIWTPHFLIQLFFYSDLVANLLLDREVASHYFTSRDQDRVWR